LKKFFLLYPILPAGQAGTMAGSSLVSPRTTRTTPTFDLNSSSPLLSSPLLFVMLVWHDLWLSLIVRVVRVVSGKNFFSFSGVHGETENCL
jgi:hypothetical protein